jgi:malonyl-CoA/methylmalonyl-CoA synthetase
MFLERFLSHAPERPALRDTEGRWLSYGELRERGERVAAGLHTRGVRAGDIVAIHLENGMDLVDAHLGCMALGAVRLPLNAHYREVELAPIVSDAAPALVCTTSPERFPGLRCGPVHTDAPEVPPNLWPAHDLTALLYTSGTTGRPKGVPQTFSMWEANLDALTAVWRLGDADCLWLALPLFHTHGLVVGLHGTLLRGSRAILAERFEPMLPEGEITHLYGVPTWYRRWLPVMQAHPESFNALRLMVSGSDGLDAATSDAVYAATGHRILERYGMTETVMICSNPGTGERRAGTVGQPLPSVEVRLVEGEIQVRGPSVFSGYRGAAPGHGFTHDGWFQTGDSGAWEPAPIADTAAPERPPYLRIIGRTKELIIVGGVNVSPAEVESVYADIPGIREVGVCGVPDADLGEVVGLAVATDGAVTEAAVRAAIVERGCLLSGLKRPRAVIFVASLPRNALGKLQRAALRPLFTPSHPLETSS